MQFQSILNAVYLSQLSLDLVLQRRDRELSFLDRGSLSASSSVRRRSLKKEALSEYSRYRIAQSTRTHTTALCIYAHASVAYFCTSTEEEDAMFSHLVL
jgi:hypothetical protein